MNFEDIWILKILRSKSKVNELHIYFKLSGTLILISDVSTDTK